MRLAAAFMLAVIFISAGCTTGAKKQAAQSPQPYTYAKPQQIPQQEVSAQTAKNAPVEPAERLSTKQIQQALKKAGFYKGEIDGKAGPKTKEAVIKFQKARGLKPDGVIGKKTSTELRRYL